MNLSFKVRSKYLYVKATGEYDLSDFIYLFHEWTDKARSHNMKCVFIDVTLVCGYDFANTDAMNIISIGKHIGESIPDNVMFVVLQTPQQMGKDTLFVNILTSRGVVYKLTSDLNEALKWLALASDKIAVYFSTKYNVSH